MLAKLAELSVAVASAEAVLAAELAVWAAVLAVEAAEDMAVTSSVAWLSATYLVATC